jgi:RNA polymerase-binding transcription factor DksA
MTTPGWPTGGTAPEKTGNAPVVSFAVCLDCGADIDSWRERLLPVPAGTLAVTERGALALRVDLEGVCDKCGGGHAEIRVEARPQVGS